MKRKLFLLALIFVSITEIIAQTPRPFQSIQSPNAASFKAGLESPVSLDVGKVGVNVPLYTVQDKDLAIPLTMRYNSNGVKPDVHPGWVGQGWSLGAGMITRNVKGLPDELYWRNDVFHNINGNNRDTALQIPGYAWNVDLNQGSDWNSTTRITDQAKDPAWKEAEPDEYFYTCGAYSGSFYLKQDGTFITQGNPGISIEANMLYDIPYFFDYSIPLDINNPNSFTYRIYNTTGNYFSYCRSYISRIIGYKITTPDGNVYEFGMYGKPFDPYGTYDEVEFTVDMFDQFYSNEIFTTWYLTKVTSPSTGATINLSYERGNPVMQSARSFSFYKAGGSAPKRGFWDWIFGPVSSYTEDAREERSGRLIRPTYLKSIETSDTQIDFATSPSNELTYDYGPIVTEIVLRSEHYNSNIASAGLYARFPIGVCYNNPTHPGYIQVYAFGADAYRIHRGDGLTEDLDFSKLKWEKLDFIGIKAKGGSAYTKTFNFNYTNNSNTRLKLLSLNDSSVPNPYVFNYDESATLPGYNSMKIDHWGYFNDTFVTVDPGNATSFTNYKTLREPVDAKLYPEILTKVTYPTQGYKEFTYEPNKYKSIVSRNTSTGAFSITALGTAKSGGGLRIAQVKEVSGNGQPDMTTTYEYGDGLLNGDVQYYWPGYTGKLFNGNTYTSDRFITESLLPTIENTAGGIVSYAKVTEKMTGLGRMEYDFKTFLTNPDVNGNSIDPQKSPYSPFSSKAFERGLVSEIRTYDNATTLPLTKETFTYQVNNGLAASEARAVASRGLTLFDGSTAINAVEGTSYTNYLYPYQRQSKQTQVLDKTTSTYTNTLEEYVYDNDAMHNDNQLKEVKTTNADGSVSTIKFKHTWDYTTGSLGTAYTEAEGLSLLYAKRIINRPLLTEVRFKKAGATLDSVTSATFNDYRKFTNSGTDFPVSNKTYKLEIPSPVPSYTLNLNSSTYTLDSRFKMQTYSSVYGPWATLQEVQTGFAKDACLWQENGRFMVAVVKNSTVDQVAYTSFEDTENGSWLAPGAKSQDATAPTGKRVYNLSGGSISKNLDNTKKYSLVFWVKGTTIPTITATLISGESGVVRTYNGWTQYRCTITSSSSVSLSGTGLIIDEVRLHPVEAAMTSYTYDPQLGMTSMTDENGAITYYDYDAALRLRSIRDLQGNVIKKFDYNYKP